MLSHLPDDTGMAFVLIQHLDPKHESHLTELLSKESKMPVSEVTGETRVEANHVYVIPPRRNLGISAGVLHTPPRPASGCNMPVDAFLRDLAADRGSKALGVILSGTASDGTLGLQAIKAAGGITFAQDVQTAKFDGMPKSAIAAGCGGLCPAAGRNRAATGGLGARCASAGRISGGDRAAGGRGIGQDTPAGAERHGSGLHALQARHPGAAHQAAHGPPRIRNAGRLQPGSRAEPRRSQRAVRKLLYHRHGILSGTSGLRGTEEG